MRVQVPLSAPKRRIKMNIVIDKEFQSLIPALTTDEYRWLEESILPKKVKGGYKYGTKGKTYKSKAKAERV